jgi:acetyl esterase/lipase
MQPFILPVWPQLTVAADALAEQYFTGVSQTGTPFGQVRNVTNPTLTVYLPDPAVATGTAVVICPGGGYHILAIDHEGHDVARWLVSRGIAAIILKYRLIPTPVDDAEHAALLSAKLADPQVMRQLAFDHNPLMQADVLEAIRIVRRRAVEWHINPQRVGVMGFSAGGHVTISAMLHYDAESRPNFAAPIYPVWFDAIAPQPDAPPVFVALANDDEFGALILNTVARVTDAWQQAHLPIEVHAYSQGGHGFGMMRRNLPSDGWIDRFHEWLMTTALR